MPNVVRVFQANLYAGADTATLIGGPDSSLTKVYTLTEAVNGSTAYSIADVYQISAQVSTGATVHGRFNIVKLGVGVYSGGNWGVYSITGIPGYGPDLSWSGPTITITWHVGSAADLVAAGMPVRGDYAIAVPFMDLWLDVVVPDTGAGGGTPAPPPAQAERALTGLSCNWHRVNHPEDVVLHALGRKAHVTWAWAGWTARPALMDELHRTVQALPKGGAKCTDVWRLLTQPGTSVTGELLFAQWDAGLWDTAQWAA